LVLNTRQYAGNGSKWGAVVLLQSDQSSFFDKISTEVKMRVSVEGIASFSGRRPWWIVLGWAIALVAAGGLASTMLESALEGEQGPTQVLEYERAQMLISDRFGPIDGTDEQSEEDTGPATSGEFVIILANGLNPGDPAFDQRVTEFGEALEAAQNDIDVEVMVGHFRDYEGMVSEDGTTLLTSIEILEEHDAHIETLLHVAEVFTDDQFEVYMVGNASINHVFSELAESDLVTGETIGVAIALIILALVFGAVVSAFIPIILAIVAIFTAIGLTAIIGQFMELNEFVPNILSMMGLAVGIDYSLFILSRYKEERERGLEKHDAIRAAGGTAGRAVVFSGLTVVLAMLGMLIIPERTFVAFGIGSILVVFVAVIVGVTLLPAIIGILGDKVQAVRAPLPLTAGLFIVGVVILTLTAGFGPDVIMVSAGVMAILIILTLIRRFSNVTFSAIFGSDEPTDPDAQSGMWNTITVNVMRRPWMSLIAASAVLLILAYFYLDLEKGTSGISVLPDEIPAKKGFQTLDEKFGFGSDAQAVVAIDGDVGSAAFATALTNLEQAMNPENGLQAPEVRIEPSVNLATLRSPIPGDPQGQKALNTIRDLRSVLIPEAFANVPDDSYEALVGGGPAEIVDSVKITDEYMPIVFASVLSLSFLLLLLAFRSITISIASILMNLLSVGAAYGLVVLVFQKGFLIDLFGFEQVDQIEFWLPLFMFSILFGLSMDYHVFMLSRIKERYDETGLASESVAFGLRKTASIITGAALIMVAVFGGFALGDIAFFQSMGFGLGAAVLLDATIVRSLLVPSVMRILGPKAWYLPKWLEWIPNISIEGSPADAPKPAAAAATEAAPAD
jgi:putative drug exporter of the RND superfamily